PIFNSSPMMALQAGPTSRLLLPVRLDFTGVEDGLPGGVVLVHSHEVIRLVGSGPRMALRPVSHGTLVAWRVFRHTAPRRQTYSVSRFQLLAHRNNPPSPADLARSPLLVGLDRAGGEGENAEVVLIHPHAV